MDRERFSFWLTPRAADYHEPAGIIAALNESYRAPKFEPHVTVYSGACSDRELLKRVIAELLAEVEPIALEVAGVRATEDFFKTLFIEFEESSVLRELHGNLKAALKQDSGYTLRPHLSLIYLDLELDRKWEIASTVSIDQSVLIFDEAKLVSPGNEDLGWRDIEKWEIWSAHTLKSRRPNET